ncbi:uncharacterized protein LOC126802719 [Argentina anserina]|uniref:uncharacterized protein LOC126802719 n=1 Tax=Argentina anserina TaxID=57926 RepID=UPI0021768634|nr:uncharacterized protein LOC126802719 [Potentilla anserina]
MESEIFEAAPNLGLSDRCCAPLASSGAQDTAIYLCPTQNGGIIGDYGLALHDAIQLSIRWKANLNRCKYKIQKWSRQKFPKCIKEEIKQCLTTLDDLQVNHSLTSIEEQREVSAALSSLWSREEKFWHQRSRVKWLQAGDSNSRFLHLSTLQRRQRNKILKIQCDSGIWLSGENKIRVEFERQFELLFTTSSNREWGDALVGVMPSVTESLNAELIAPVTIEEVKEVTFQLGALKAPGPDGFPGLFYHKYWSIVKDVVATATVDFLAGKVCLKELNRTNIVLIPKVENPNAFVPGRQIQDNLLVAHEAYHYLKLKREGGNHELGLKLDMNKAYDRVEWLGYFYLTRGLRQGDPLSPYLFLIISEVLSVRLTKAVHEESLVGIKLTRKSPTLSHLFFADDSLFFIKATLSNVKQLLVIFKAYCTTSGQVISVEKSSVYFSPNTPEQMVLLISEMMGFAPVIDPGKYLGMPSLWGRSKKDALGYIMDRVKKKVVGWKQKTLSWAGKEVLIKAVATAIPAYPMSCFKLPIGVCESINLVLGNFWWGSNDTSNRIHWKSWNFLCKPKDDGGLGFRDIHILNMSLLAKQCWRLVQEPDSLWARIMKARYFPDCSIFEATKGYRASWSWASIIEARDLLVKGGCWQVENGQSINIWGNKWKPPPDLHDGFLINGVTAPTDIVLVNQLIDWDTHSWYLDNVKHIISGEAAARIACLPIGNVDGKDRFIWPWTKNVVFTVKSGYHWLQNIHALATRNVDSARGSHLVNCTTWKLIWRLHTLPKIKLFLWQVLGGVGPVFLNLYKRKMVQTPLCPICGQDEESFEHLFLLCSWVATVWFGSPLGLRIDKAMITSFDRWLYSLSNSFRDARKKDVFLSLCSSICWMIWKARCNYVYKGTPLSPMFTINQAIKLATEFIEVKVIHSKDKLAGLGVVVRDESGRFIEGLAATSSCLSCDQAEAEAVLMGVNLAVSQGRDKFVIESDSKTVIDGLRYKSNNCWRIYPILRRIWSLSNGISDCIWSWAPREANGAAHRPATLADETVGLKRWVNRPPRPLFSVLRNDGMPTPPMA